ncbi:MAG: hypothetical protein ABR551_08310 [Gemmatimonadales bacterium]
MTAVIEQLQRTIDTEKATISRNLGALEDKARDMVDWREQIRARPWGALGLALLGGGAVAVLFGGRHRKSPRAAAAGGAEPKAPRGSRPHNARRRIVEALTTLAMARAVDAFHPNAPRKGVEPE